MNLIAEKIQQAYAILEELDIDLWLTLCREDESTPDPAAGLISESGIVWLTGFFVSRSGQTVVLAGSADAPEFERSTVYDEVVTYGDDVGKEIRRIAHQFNPRAIALNYSKNNITADGLSHGLYLQLCEDLAGTPYVDRFCSAEDVIARVRGRKSPHEIERLAKAAALASECWNEALQTIAPGMSEIQVAQLVEGLIRKRGCEPSFESIVNAGAKTVPGHCSPTHEILEGGDLLHIDFGVRFEGYCSDIQRLAYLSKKGESAPPADLQAAFDKVKDIVDTTSKMYRPGVSGHQIDEVARRMLTDDGFPEYNHALGHQIGRAVHDGAAIVGPRWKRYGSLVEVPLEVGNTFTVELGITVDKIGYVGLEEDLVVTEDGGRFLGPRQTELVAL